MPERSICIKVYGARGADAPFNDRSAREEPYVVVMLTLSTWHLDLIGADREAGSQYANGVYSEGKDGYE